MITLRKNDPTPLYTQVKDELRRELQSGAFSPDQPLPDERQLAEQLGLSRTTVRRAILELTGDGLLHRIRGRGTFVKAEAITGSRRKAPPAVLQSPGSLAPAGLTVGLLTCAESIQPQDGMFYYRIIQSLQKELGNDVSLVFRRVCEDGDQTVEALRKEARLSGIIVIGLLDCGLLDKMRKLKIPIVLVDCGQATGDPIFHEVTYEPEEPSFRAVRALLEMGHRDIGLMMHESPLPEPPNKRWRKFNYAQGRRIGYERALKAHGLELREEFISAVLPCSSSAYARMRAILNTGPVPTAMFCSTDEIAIGVIQAVKDSGRRVPEFLSVAGFGDAGYFCTPLLSTVRVPTDAMGLAAARLLKKSIASRSTPAERVLVQTDWMPRASCDVPRA